MSQTRHRHGVCQHHIESPCQPERPTKAVAEDYLGDAAEPRTATLSVESCHQGNNRIRGPLAAFSRNRQSSRRGATAVEFAVVAPVFFALVLGLVEFGRMTMVKQALSDAACVGCRTASLATTKNASTVQIAVRESLAPFMSASGDSTVCRIAVQPTDFSETERGEEITVDVEVNFSDVSWISLGYLEDSVLTGESTMKRE